VPRLQLFVALPAFAVGLAPADLSHTFAPASASFRIDTIWLP
jgi:hypothetical protein